MDKKRLYSLAGMMLLFSVGTPLLLRLIFPSENEGTTILSMISTITVALTGIALLGTAFKGDLVPDIVLVGLFGILALVAGIGFLSNIVWLFNYGNIKVLWTWWMVIDGGLVTITYASMAAIIALKDTFGGFFFVPAGLRACTAFVWFLVHCFGIFGMMPVGFMASFLELGFGFLKVGALLFTGIAINSK